MSPESLKQRLSNHYDLVCFEDFARLTAGTESLYDMLERHRLDQYQPQQRLVFYTQHRLSLNQLCHLQLAATLVDISNSFIMLCTPYDLSNDLTTANQQHGNDSIVIECKIVAVDSKHLLSTEFAALETLCPLPWTHLNISIEGNITPCCHSNQKLGHIQHHQLHDVFHSDSMQLIRSQMLRGEKPKACEGCFAQEKHNHQSPRQHLLGLHKKTLLSTYMAEVKIHSLDLKLGNTCNFKCKICSKKFSSQHASEDLKYTQDPQQKIDIQQSVELGQWYDHNDYFLKQLDLLWPDLYNIDLTGGEPFLLKKLPDLLNRACELGHAKHIRLHFNTNGSVWPEKLINLLHQFDAIDIALSIDNIGQRFEIERGGVWSDVEQNIYKFRSLDRKKFRVYIYCAVNIQNVLDLDDLYNWAESIGIDVVLTWVIGPNYLCIDNLTDKAKALVVSKYQNSHRPELQQIVNRVQHSKGSDGREFIAAMQQFDQRRKQNLILSHKPIAIAMGFVA